MDLFVAILFGLLALFGVSGGEASATAEPGVTVEPSSGAATTDPVQDQFLVRVRLPSCGVFSVDHGFYEQAAQPGWRCLEKAADGRGAEAEFVVKDIGAAPVDSYVRVADGEMEIYVNDPAANSFDAWTYDSCPTDVASFRQGCP
jgi:hypothetical protein